MIGILVKITVKPHGHTDFENAFAAQAQAVRSHENGNRLYDLFRSRTHPNQYTLVEIYNDEAALEAHRTSAHMTAHRARTALFVSEEPEIAEFDVVIHP